MQGGEGEGVIGFRKTSHRAATAISGVRKRRGAPPGNTRALKHGRYTGEILSMLKLIAGWNRSTRAILKDVEEKYGAPRRKRKSRRKE